jgi:hypothetical protein
MRFPYLLSTYALPIVPNFAALMRAMTISVQQADSLQDMRLKKSLTGKFTKINSQVGEDKKKVGKIQNARDFEGLVPKRTCQL